jgi:hypothetical protein
MRNGTVTIPTGLTEPIITDLVEWRKAHKAPTPLPEVIWSRAADLAARYGVHKTARTLGLNYIALRKHVGAEPARPSVRGFVELLPAVPGTIPECIIELEAGAARLRVQMNNLSATSVASILRELCR